MVAFSPARASATWAAVSAKPVSETPTAAANTTPSTVPSGASSGPPELPDSTTARIGGIQNAQGPNIYQTSTVTRQIYEIRAVVESGNSGGPLLSPEGTVDGVVFAAAVGVPDTGFALTAAEVSADASAGAQSTSPVSTMGCD